MARGLGVFDENPVYGGKRRVLVPQVDEDGRIIPGQFLKYNQEDFLLRYHGPHPKNPKLPNFFKVGEEGVNKKGNTIKLRYRKPIFLNAAQEEIVFGKAKRREEKKANRRLIDRLEQDERNIADMRLERNRKRKRSPPEQNEDEEEPLPQRQKQAMKIAQKQAQEEEEEGEQFFEEPEWGEWGGERSSSQQRKQRQREDEENLQLAIQEARNAGARSRSKSKSPSRGAGGGGGALRRSKSRSSSPKAAARKRSRSRSRDNAKVIKSKGRGKNGGGGGGGGGAMSEEVNKNRRAYANWICKQRNPKSGYVDLNDSDWVNLKNEILNKFQDDIDRNYNETLRNRIIDFICKKAKGFNANGREKYCK